MCMYVSICVSPLRFQYNCYNATFKMSLTNDNKLFCSIEPTLLSAYFTLMPPRFTQLHFPVLHTWQQGWEIGTKRDYIDIKKYTFLFYIHENRIVRSA